MKKAIIFLLLAYLPFAVVAQHKEGKQLIDSLLAELPKAKEDTGKVKLLCTLSRTYYEFDLGEGFKYAKQAIALAENLGYKHGIARAYNISGGIRYLKGDVPEAIKDNTAALKTYKETGDKVGMANCYLTLGNGYANYDNYPETFKNYFAALKMYEEAGDKKGISGCYNNLGAIYHEMKNDSQALKYYAAGLKIAEKIGPKGRVASLNDNIGSVWFERDSFPEALKYYSAALKIFEEIGQKNGIASCNGNIGSVYRSQGNYEGALEKYFEALKLHEEIDNKYNIGITLGNIAFTYYKQKKYREAEHYYSKQLAIGKEIRSFIIIKNASHGLSEVYAQTGDFKKAFDSYKSFVAAKDSVFNKDNTEKRVQSRMQYDFEKKESLAKAEQAKKDAVLKLKLQRKNILVAGAAGAFGVFMVFGLLLFRQNKLRASHQKTELEQKQLRAQMNPHFIFNCLNSIQHFIVANDVKNANKYLSGFALLMRQTLENSKEGVITLRQEIEYLENYLTLERMRFEDKFTYEIVCAEHVNKDRIEIPSMIIQPFIENAIRHGLCYLEGKPGILKISFYIKDNNLYCEVDDNGIGREQSQKLKAISDLAYESRGMELTKQRLALVSKSTGSEYKVDIRDKKNDLQQPDGTVVTIKFPLES